MIDQLVTLAPALIALALLGIVASIAGLIVEHRRRWPHGRDRICNNPGCQRSRTLARKLTKNGPLL